MEQVREENRRRITDGESRRLLNEAAQRQAAAEQAGKTAVREEAEEKVKLTDELLDEIDNLLEENLEMAQTYEQRGGQ